MSDETRRHLKPVGTRPGIIYGSGKVHKKCVYGCPPFRSILSTLQTPMYKLAKYLVPIPEPLTKNKYAVKDLFNFSTEFVEQDSSNFMEILDIDSLFTNIHLKNFALIIFLNTAILFMVWKFKDLLYLTTKESHFIFNNILCQQIVGTAMGSP